MEGRNYANQEGCGSEACTWVWLLLLCQASLCSYRPLWCAIFPKTALIVIDQPGLVFSHPHSCRQIDIEKRHWSVVPQPT